MTTNLADVKWRRLNGERLVLPIKDQVELTIKEQIDLGYDLKICIGSDSQMRGDIAEFATVIVFVRKQKGGFMFICKYKELRHMTLKERMILEVFKSIEIAYHLCDLLDRYDIELEVHADINSDPAFDSNIALKDAMGYILGMGFTFKAKPHAFASSNCADKIA